MLEPTRRSSEEFYARCQPEQAERRWGAHSRGRVRALLCTRHTGRWSRPDHRRSGVAKATFYKHFPAKDDLVLAYLDRVDDIWTGQLKEAAAAAGPDPADQLVGMFDALSSACRRESYRGCAFINAAAESQPGTPVHDRTVVHKAAVLARVGELAEQARVRDPEQLARSLTLLLDGGLASGSLDASPEAPEAAKVSAQALVAAATRARAA